MADTGVLKEIFHGHLTEEQVITFLTALKDEEIKIKVLRLRALGERDEANEDDSEINPDIMGGMYELMMYPSFKILKPQETKAIYRHHLTNEEFNIILEDLKASNNTHDKSVKLETWVSSGIDPDLIVGAFSKVESFNTIGNVFDQKQAEALFTAIKDGVTCLKSIKIELCNLGDVDGALMGEAIAKVESVELSGGLYLVIKPSQVEAILAAVKDGDGTLKSLKFSGIYMKNVDPSIMAEGFAKVETVAARGCTVTFDQSKAILTKINNDEIVLKSLDLVDTVFGSKDTDLFASALCKLETVNIEQMDGLSSDGLLNALLRKIRDEDVALKNLDLSTNELTDLDADLLSSTVCKLDSVSLKGTRLTKVQIEAILTAISSESELKLKHIDFGKNHFFKIRFADEDDLEHFDDDEKSSFCLTPDTCDQPCTREAYHGGVHVNPDLLIAFSKLETLCLCGADFSTEDMKRVASVINEESKLKNLDIYGLELKDLEPGLIANAATKLERVDLRGTMMTKEQTNMLLEQVLEGTSLQVLKIDAADIEEIGTNLNYLDTEEGANHWINGPLVKKAKDAIDCLDINIINYNSNDWC